MTWRLKRRWEVRKKYNRQSSLKSKGGPTRTALFVCLEESVITKVKFLGVCVSDQQRALEFYTQKLGFIVKTDQPMGPQRWIELEIPGAETRVVLFTPRGQEDRVGTFVNTSFDCDNLEGTYEELKSRGVEFTTPPTAQPWGTFAIFKDPDGNSFVLGKGRE